MESWPVTAADVFTGLADWRAAHPQATLREIEGALDERLGRCGHACWKIWRWRVGRPTWRRCRTRSVRRARRAGGAWRRVEARGAKVRRLTTTYERQITLTRSYAVCPACGTGLFPFPPG